VNIRSLVFVLVVCLFFGARLTMAYELEGSVSTGSRSEVESDQVTIGLTLYEEGAGFYGKGGPKSWYQFSISERRKRVTALNANYRAMDDDELPASISRPGPVALQFKQRFFERARYAVSGQLNGFPMAGALEVDPKSNVVKFDGLEIGRSISKGGIKADVNGWRLVNSTYAIFGGSLVQPMINSKDLIAPAVPPRTELADRLGLSRRYHVAFQLGNALVTGELRCEVRHRASEPSTGSGESTKKGCQFERTFVTPYKGKNLKDEEVRLVFAFMNLLFPQSLGFAGR
jgi:hypothetical protein